MALILFPHVLFSTHEECWLPRTPISDHLNFRLTPHLPWEMLAVRGP